MTTPPAESAPAKGKKGPPEGLVIPPKKPKLSKAERRALQEAQRAAKAQKQQGKKPQPQKQPSQDHKKQSAPSSASPQQPVDVPQDDDKTVALFSHLPPYRNPNETFLTGPTIQSQSSTANNLHPAVIQLGHDYATGRIRAANARCRAMLQCYAQLLQDFEPNTKEDLRHVIDHALLKPAFQYWTQQARPHSVSMGNAFSFLKTAVASLDRDMPYVEMRQVLLETISAFIRERIELAGLAIAQKALSKLQQPQQVLLTFGHAKVISTLLQKLATEQPETNFRLIVVDSRPLLEGKRLLREVLPFANIECSYILLNSLTYVMANVSKVILGASALMSDGSVLGRVGTAVVALSAQSHNVPVLVCCETYKISNRVALESITSNELGPPESVSTSLLDKSHLQLLNLLYDLTPPNLISGIVTELGIVPPTSVAVLLREMQQQQQ